MNYLIDTHAFLWYITNDPSLSQTAKQIIGNHANTIFVSIASMWEISIKVSQNKLTIIPQPFIPFIENQLKINDFLLLPIKLNDVGVVSTLPFYHKDPFDRIMIAQAMVNQMPLISVDALFDSYPITKIW